MTTVAILSVRARQVLCPAAPLQTITGIDAKLMSYTEHALSTGEDSQAVAYVQLRFGWDQSAFGVGVHPNIVTAALKAILSAVNRGVAMGYLSLSAPDTPKVVNLR